MRLHPRQRVRVPGTAMHLHQVHSLGLGLRFGPGLRLGLRLLAAFHDLLEVCEIEVVPAFPLLSHWLLGILLDLRSLLLHQGICSGILLR